MPVIWEAIHIDINELLQIIQDYKSLKDQYTIDSIHCDLYESQRQVWLDARVTFRDGGCLQVREDFDEPSEFMSVGRRNLQHKSLELEEPFGDSKIISIGSDSESLRFYEDFQASKDNMYLNYAKLRSKFRKALTLFTLVSAYATYPFEMPGKYFRQFVQDYFPELTSEFELSYHRLDRSSMEDLFKDMTPSEENMEIITKVADSLNSKIDELRKLRERWKKYGGYL